MAFVLSLITVELVSRFARVYDQADSSFLAWERADKLPTEVTFDDWVEAKGARRDFREDLKFEDLKFEVEPATVESTLSPQGDWSVDLVCVEGGSGERGPYSVGQKLRVSHTSVTPV